MRVARIVFVIAAAVVSSAAWAEDPEIESTEASAIAVERCTGGCFNAAPNYSRMQSRAADAALARQLMTETKGAPPPVGQPSTVDEH